LSPTKDFELAWEGVHDYGCQISQENLLGCTRVMVSLEICLHSDLKLWRYLERQDHFKHSLIASTYPESCYSNGKIQHH